MAPDRDGHDDARAAEAGSRRERTDAEREHRAGAVATWPRRLTAEAFGAFALVFAAAGGDVMGQVSHDAVGVVARAVAPGLMVAALIYSIGDTSGAHFNPAVTFAFALKRLVPISWLPRYWVAQVIGAIAAAAVLRALFGGAIEAGVSRPKLVDPPAALALEVILTLLLVSVILGTADRYRVVGPNAALAVGATIALCALIALPIEGASMNPARSLGPALVAGQLADIWVYVLGPAIGAILAVALTSFLHGPVAGDGKAQEAARGSR
jgi:aquaporin Z